MTSDDPFRLDGRVAVVTGASSGIGEQAARALAAAGAAVVVVARRRDRLDRLAAELPVAVAIDADLSDPDEPSRVIQRAVDELGRVDVVVNSAGTTNVARALVEDRADVSRVLDVNVIASYAMAQAAAGAMKAEGGSIINVSSVIAAVSEPTIPQAAYAASKGALTSLTRELACQWARYGIRVNALAPGWFPTEMTEGLTADADRLDAFEARIPMGRLGRLDELDGPVVFLASAASSYLTGQTLVVDGGISGI